ncbi:acyl-CoA dehydrogenase family protein [Streptomyces sp. NPDC059740]|uniref:acyl-CoA dehydrogenase family protein n=1 Tax=Streptomyces sp. NPDC059740 TaxID=3346926 RepID=UPI0036660035
MAAPTGTTHSARNQPEPLVRYDVFTSDAALSEAVTRHLPEEHLAQARRELSELGRSAGSARAQRWGRLAGQHPPRLLTHDRTGDRLDEVEYHPAYHRLLGHAVSAGLTDAWSRPGGHVRRTAGLLVWSQAEAGHCAALSTTHAVVPALRTEPAVAREWEPALLAHLYVQELLPIARKSGVLAGVAVTERQGGGARGVATHAEPLAGGGEYLLTGHKWFCTAPMSDAFLVLARAPGGPTAFWVPRVLADGSRNALRLERLKEQLGSRAEAVAEVSFDGSAWARRIGEEGRGAEVLAPAAAQVRLDCVTGAAATMRQAVAVAVHHCHGRAAGDGTLADRPLMRGVLADLALESEAATVLALRLAAAQDAGTEAERAFARIAVPAAKYWVTRRCTPLVGEALECLGGDGYVEEFALARLLRGSPLPAVAAGAGNVQALEVVRLLREEPACLDALLTEIGATRGIDHRLDAAARGLLGELAELADGQSRARRVVERLALVLQASLLVRYAPAEVSDAFCAGRLGVEAGAAFGTLPQTLDLSALVARARVAEWGR